MKLGAFLKQYLKQSLQAFKHPKQLLPTIILTVVWIILGILQIKLKENLPMKVLNFITYAQGGLYGGVASAIGGILGKVLVAGFVNALIVPLFMGKKPFNGMGNGFKELGKSLSLQGRKALAPLLKGFGAALILYGLSNTGGRFENSMAGIMAAVSLALAMGKKNGFLWNFACSYAQSVSKGKTPDYHSILRALTGMTLGFTLGVGMHAAGIGMVGLLGVAFLLLGWILGWGTKKEAIVAMALIALTLMPAPEAQAQKDPNRINRDWENEIITISGDDPEEYRPAEGLMDRIRRQFGGEHSDETGTVIRDVVAGIMAGGAAAGAAAGAGAGGAAGAAGGGPFGGDFPGGGEGPDGNKSEEEKDWERQMEEYKKWEKSKFDKYTRKNPDGTITVTDPSTGKSSVWYPKEGGGYENENGTPYSDNDLANWLDERERNSDYNRQNAETTEKNLEEWRKRNEELKDMDREIYEERKSAREEQYRRDERIRRLADKYHTDDDPFEVYEALAKEIEEAEAASEKARDKQAFWEGVVAVGDVVQATCDGLIAVIASGTGPAGKAIQATYIVGKNTLGRTSEALMARKQGLEGAAAGALKGFGVGVIDAAANLIPIKTDTLTGIAVTNFTKSFFTTLTIAINGHLDGKSKEEVKKEAIKAGIVQAVSTGMGAVLGKTIFGTETTPTPDKYKNTILTLGGKDLFSTDYSGTTADNLTALFESSVAQLNAGISGSKEIDRALDIN